MQHAVGRESIHTMGNGCQLTIYHGADVREELHDQYIAARNGKPPWVTRAFLHTVRKIDHHDVVSCRMFMDEFHDNHPGEWTKPALITLRETTEGYMVEVIAASYCLN
jgi:hypothetical protein